MALRAVRPHLYGVPETTLPPSYPKRGNLSLFSLQNQPTVYIRIANPSRGEGGGGRGENGWKKLGWASCLTSASRVTRASGTTFPHINALARQTGTTLGVASVTLSLNLGFKAGIRLKEVKINSAKPTVIEWPSETQRKRNICTIDYSIKVWITCWDNFDSTYRDYVSTFKRSIKLSWGKGSLGYPRPFNWRLNHRTTTAQTYIWSSHLNGLVSFCFFHGWA